MKLLLLSPHFYPSNDPRSNRWSVLAAEWVRMGHEVRVLTARYGDSPVRETWKGVLICRKAYKNVQDVFVRPGQRERAVGSGHFRVFYYLNKYLWRPLHWPDSSVLWYLPARREALKMAASWRPDALVSVALPMTAHAVALAVKKAHPDLFWLADWGDPFSLQRLCPPNNRRLYGALNRRLERAVFRHADAHVFTTEATRAAYRALYPEAFAKCHVAPPVLSLPVGESLRGVRPRFARAAGQVLRLAYFGTFTPRLREPEPMLRLLDAWRKETGRAVALHLYGRLPEPFHPLLKRYDFVSYHGLLPRERVWEEMGKADVLVSVGNRSALQLPGKSVEYLASGLPVLHFQEVEEDPVCELFAGLEQFCAVPVWKDSISRQAFRQMQSFFDSPLKEEALSFKGDVHLGRSRQAFRQMQSFLKALQEAGSHQAAALPEERLRPYLPEFIAAFYAGLLKS